jgi:ATP-dependent RNA helicase DeaD
MESEQREEGRPGLDPKADDEQAQTQTSADEATPEEARNEPDDEAPGAAPASPFSGMGLSPEIVRALEEMGFVEPRDVQIAVFEPAMAGRDLIVQAKTGSGKTAAFGIPIIQRLTSDKSKVEALCLCPTRELALQVAGECIRIATHKKVQVVPIYGGAPMGRQIEALKEGAHFVVGTPGRVMDHIRRGTLRLSELKVLVLDEADEMLSMGFLPDILEILERLPKNRQTLLFSATVPEEIQRIATRHMREPVRLELSGDFIGVEEISHHYYMVSGMGRPRDLVRVLEVEKPGFAIIFCNTREDTGLVASYLQRHGYRAEAISSDLTQRDRERVMGMMRRGELTFLVATDVAARGIDISDLSHVINYTFPESADVYIHRTGRTGRAGKSGVAISLISPRELGSLYYLKLLHRLKPEERALPTDAELKTRREADRYAEIAQAVKDEVSDEWRSLARRVWSSAQGERIVAALLRRVLEQDAAPPFGRPDRPTPIGGAEAAAGASPAAPEMARGPESEAAREPRPEWRARERGGERGGERGRSGDRSRGGRGDRDRGREARGSDRERGRERGERGERGGERGGRDRAGARGRDRDRDRDRDRSGTRRPDEGERREGRSEGERREGRPEGAPADAAPPPPRPERPSPGSEDREFWETWVDERIQSGPGAAPPTPAPPAAEPAASGGEGGEAGETGGPTALEPGMTRLYLNLGRRDRLRAPEIQALLAERTGMPDLRIQVRNTHTYIVLPEADAPRVVNALNGTRHGERDLVCEPAKKGAA